MTNDAALILANCLEAIERHELTLGEYIARWPDQSALLSELVPVAQRLRTAPRVRPSLDFRADARTRLIAQLRPRHARRAEPVILNWVRVIPSAARNFCSRLAAQSVITKIPGCRSYSAALRGLTSAAPRSVAPRNDPVRIGGIRLLRALAVLAILIVLGGSVVSASAQSLPNEVLYPVKITIERVRLALSPDPLLRGELSLNFADERLNEVQRLIDRGEGSQAVGALDAFAAQFQSASELAHGLPASVEREVLLAHLQISVDRSNALLINSEGRLPNSAQPAIQRAHAALRGAPLHDAPPTPSTSTPTPTPIPTSVSTSKPPASTHVPPVTLTPRSGIVPTMPPTHVVPTLTVTATMHWPTFAPTRWPAGLPTRWLMPIATWHPTFVPPTLSTRPPRATLNPRATLPTRPPHATSAPVAWPTWPSIGSPHPTAIWPTPHR